jgi:hypothetical protein
MFAYLLLERLRTQVLTGTSWPNWTLPATPRLLFHFGKSSRPKSLAFSPNSLPEILTYLAISECPARGREGRAGTSRR